jgi:hypothetical protein
MVSISSEFWTDSHYIPCTLPQYSFICHSTLHKVAPKSNEEIFPFPLSFAFFFFISVSRFTFERSKRSVSQLFSSPYCQTLPLLAVACGTARYIDRCSLNIVHCRVTTYQSLGHAPHSNTQVQLVFCSVSVVPLHDFAPLAITDLTLL